MGALTVIEILSHPFFGYTTTRMLLAAATALLLTIGVGPAFIRILYRLKIGQKIRLDECSQTR